MLLVMFKVKMMQMGTKRMRMTMKSMGKMFSEVRRSISEVTKTVMSSAMPSIISLSFSEYLRNRKK